MANLRDDIEFIKKEFGVLKKFLKNYFKERRDDSKFSREVSYREYGPFNMAKLAIAIIATIICLFTFHLYRSRTAVWVVIFFFIVFYDLLFDQKWVIPVLKELFGFFMQVPVLLFETVVDILMYIKDAIVSMLKSKEE